MAVALPGRLSQRFAEGGAGGRGPGHGFPFQHQQLAVGEGAHLGGHRVVEQQRVDAHEVAGTEGQQRQRFGWRLGSQLADAFLDDPDRSRRPVPAHHLAGPGGLLAEVAGDPAQDLLGNGQEE